MMKTKAMTTSIGLLLLVLIITGCSSTKDYNIVRVIKVAPEDTFTIMYFDLETLKGDPDCEQMYHDLRDSIESQMEGLQFPDVDGYGLINVGNMPLTIEIGEYVAANMRGALKEQGGIKDEYQGSEIWTSDMYRTTRAFAFIDNMVIFGDKNAVEASIRSYNNEPSLHDNEDLKIILDELPNGFFYIIINTITKQHISRYGSTIGCICMCNLIRGDEFLDIKGLLKFESEADAETYSDRTKEIAEAFFFGTPLDIEVKLKGQYIEITGTSDIEDF